MDDFLLTVMHVGSAYVTMKCIFHVLRKFRFSGLTLIMQNSMLAIALEQTSLLMQKQ